MSDSIQLILRGTDAAATWSSEDTSVVTVSADGTVSAPREPVYTKNELGDRYGMRSASALGKEWYEHSAGWCGYLKGKNAVEIGKLSADGTDADLKALCTISVTDLQKAVLKAMAEQ